MSPKRDEHTNAEEGKEMIRRRRDYIMIMIMRLGQGYVIDRGRSGLLKDGGQKHHHGYLPTSPASSVSPSAALQDSSQNSPNASPALNASS